MRLHALAVETGTEWTLGARPALHHLGNDMGHHRTGFRLAGRTVHVSESALLGTLLDAGQPLQACVTAALPDGGCRIDVTLGRELAPGERLALHDASTGGIDAQLFARNPMNPGNPALPESPWYTLAALPGCSYRPLRSGPAGRRTYRDPSGTVHPVALQQGLERYPSRLLERFRHAPWQDLAPAAIALQQGGRITGFLLPVWSRDLEQLLLRGERLEARVNGHGGSDHPGAARLEVVLVG